MTDITLDKIQWKVWQHQLQQPREGDVCPLCGGIGAITVEAPINHPAFGRSFFCICRRGEIESKRLKAMLSNANIPEKYLGFTLDTFEQRSGGDPEKALAADYCRWFASQDQVPHHEDDTVKRGLYLYGDFGVGKTGLAATVLNERLARGQSVVWLSFIRFIGDVQDTYSNQAKDGKRVTRKDVISAAAEAELLLVDDMGDRDAKRDLSDDQRNITFELIEARYVNRLPNIITSNLAPAEFMAQFKGRIAQRVFEMCHAVHVGGPTLRK